MASRNQEWLQINQKCDRFGLNDARRRLNPLSKQYIISKPIQDQILEKSKFSIFWIFWFVGQNFFVTKIPFWLQKCINIIKSYFLTPKVLPNKNGTLNWASVRKSIHFCKNPRKSYFPSFSWFTVLDAKRHEILKNFEIFAFFITWAFSQYVHCWECFQLKKSYGSLNISQQ